MHSLEDIVMSLLDAGLRLGELREHQHVRRFHSVMPPDRLSLPLGFSLRATKPG